MHSGGIVFIAQNNKFIRINERIQAPELRVLNPDNTQLGVMSREEALQKAREQELDLVEVAANANPPVVKIIDFKKYRYQEQKKEQAARRNAREVELKEVWLSPRIAQHDLETRLKKAQEFLARGDQVKITVKFKGREMSHPDLGFRVIEQVKQFLGERIKIQREAKFEGRSLAMIVANK